MIGSLRDDLFPMVGSFWHRRGMRLIWIVSASVAALFVWVAWTFNRLVSLRNSLREAWSGIDVQLKRRHDLVPVLVEFVRGYRDHERGVFENVTAARVAAESAKGTAATGEAERELTAGLRQLVAVVEGYPQLKASENFLELSRQLVEVEDQLQFARRYYNGTAKILNNLVGTIPTMLIARPFGFRPADFFEVESVIEREAPKVKS